MINVLWASMFEGLTVFAQGGRLVNLGERFRPGGSTVDATNFALLVVVLVTAAVLLSLLARHINTRDQRGQDNPRRLFSELCRAHRLAGPERRLLRQLALWHHLTYPAQLFLEPQRFEAGELQATFADQMGTLQELQKKLFQRSEQLADEEPQGA